MAKPVDWTVGIPAQTLINQGTRVSGKFPTTSVNHAHSVLYRTDETDISSYIVDDDDGRAIKRVDLRGRSHASIPTPHVVEYRHNKNSKGTLFVQAEKTVRPAHPDEIP